MVRVSLVLLILGSVLIGWVSSHQESGEWSCESDPGIRMQAEFRPGLVTLDGRADDWKDIDGFEFSLLPALDPDDDKEYKGGKMTVKALHDGKDLFFSLQVDGDYAYSKGNNNKCPSVALMFPIGDHGPITISKTCKGHEVDIMHFSIGNAIPGRLYGGNLIDNSDGNGGDRFCRGDSPYSSDGQKGTYFFEFSRPLRTMDRLQQDAQFTISGSSKMSVAFWYPVNGNPWYGSGHYSVNCDWIPLDISPGSSMLTASSPASSGDVGSAFALLFSVVSLCLSVFVGYRVARPKGVPFTPMGTQMENL
ncbi:hypothetical protein GH714_022558 [Hevea brasiliensis]|uniref:Cytochrome c-552/DMSO reductase-like haem-binding domain-containing protein n=1 Tax=Hevea brasiliensis TaxID=3981 RepID=A0A6A6NIP7_HEVBR|nr:hypothetical protein GH714_022558 [Hevea brasiliensis]